MKVIKLHKWMEQEWVMNQVDKNYTAKITGAAEIVNFIQKHDKHGDMTAYYNEVLAGEAALPEFLDRLEEYMMDTAVQESPANGGQGVSREWFEYLGILRKKYTWYKDK